MARDRINLNLDREVYDRVRSMLERAPGKNSVSGLVNELLRDFADRMEPVLEAALAGDEKAALALLQATTLRDFVTVSQGMVEMIQQIHNKWAAGGAVVADG